jgi:Na+-driven multidrug efflux pump
MQHAFRFKVIFTVSVSILYGTLCWLIPEKMLSIMTHGNTAQGEIIAIGARYLRLTSFTLIPMAISSAIGTSFREIAKPAVPLCISAAATLINTLGNWILIYGNLGAPRLEVSGAAMATIIARAVEVCVFLIYVRRGKAPFAVPVQQIPGINKKLVREILAKSWMMFVAEASWLSSETVTVALYNGRGGAEVVAGMAAGWTVANIFNLLFNGIHATTAVVIGGVLGAGKLDEARKRAEWLKSGSVIAGVAVALLGFVVTNSLVPMVFHNLTDSTRSISLGLVHVILIYYPFWALINALFAISRAGGDTVMAMWADTGVNTLLFIPGAFILAFCTSVGPVTMYALVKLSDIAKYLVARHFIKKERWVKNLAKNENFEF